MLEQYRISDFIEWNRQKTLRLNPEFQRGMVWVPSARVYLIDTILRSLPVPKIYLRSTIDVHTQTAVREVVDGQQRLRAILDFSDGKIRLTARAGEFSGLTYFKLPYELKQRFLEYPLAVEQLLNASEDDVLEVFARLNSYNISLNPAERRHARFQGKFKWSVRNLAREWSILWAEYGILSTRQRVRMEDDVAVAQMLMVAVEGLMDGGADKIDKFYKARDDKFPEEDQATELLNLGLSWFRAEVGDTISNTKLASAPQLVVLFAAIAHRLRGIPAGDVEGEFPPGGTGFGNIETVRENLLVLAHALEADDPPDRFSRFVTRSISTTQSIASRQVRFEFFFRALGDEAI